METVLNSVEHPNRVKPQFAEQENSSDGPRPLPYSAYPKAADVARHGLQPLPESLLLVDFERARPHRSNRYSTVVAAELTTEQLLQTSGPGRPSRSWAG